MSGAQAKAAVITGCVGVIAEVQTDHSEILFVAWSPLCQLYNIMFSKITTCTFD